MNFIATTLLGVISAALLLLPRRWALMALVGGTCYLGQGQGFEISEFTFTTMRVLVVVGILRVIIRGERLSGGFNGLDCLMILWAIWICISSRFHNDPQSDLIFKLGAVFNTCGVYFLARVLLASVADVVHLFRVTAIVLVPIASGMICEHLFFRNPFSVLTSVPETPMVRDGRIRSFGPFAHPILAGTSGAVALPLMAGLWRSHRKAACLGGVVCLAIVGTSGSSGPVMSAVSGLLALCAWPYRSWMRALRWATVPAYIALDMVMKAPAYYIISRLDVTGSSTGWHRAALIESSLAHINEWWLAGTDFTRHWMPSGVSWNPNHTDITNHYLEMGVLGGLPLMGFFIGFLVRGFSYVGIATKTSEELAQDHFMFWALGSALFAHATTMISVSYFDQSVVFLYLTLAAIASGFHARSSQQADGQSVTATMELAVEVPEIQRWGSGGY